MRCPDVAPTLQKRKLLHSVRLPPQALTSAYAVDAANLSQPGEMWGPRAPPGVPEHPAFAPRTHSTAAPEERRVTYADGRGNLVPASAARGLDEGG